VRKKKDGGKERENRIMNEAQVKTQNAPHSSTKISGKNLRRNGKRQGPPIRKPGNRHEKKRGDPNERKTCCNKRKRETHLGS